MTLESPHFDDQPPTLPRWLVYAIVIGSLVLLLAGLLADAL
jgi:hypothetical protein